MTSQAKTHLWVVLGDIGFVVSCAVTSFAFLSVFVRFGVARSKIFDSLSANVYGMYLIHYAFVSWLQYALLPASLSAVAKAAFVFFGTLALSWGSVAALRRIRAVAKTI